VLKIHLAICLASVDVAAFWRLIDPDSKVAARLTVDSEWIAAQRAAEQVV
jgi:hypothetical protein